MGLRAHVARNRAVLLDSDTFDLDLKGFGAISAIDLIIRATNGATSNQGVPISTDVDTIEVVDGSRVLHSLSGVQERVLNTFEQGEYPAVTLDEQAAVDLKGRRAEHGQIAAVEDRLAGSLYIIAAVVRIEFKLAGLNLDGSGIVGGR